MAQNRTSKLLKFFGIGLKKTNPHNDQKEIVPKDPKTGRIIKTNDKFEALWNWYVNQTADSAESLKNRFDRYDDLEYMLYNDTIISMAADLYADEGSQCDAQTEPVIITAKKQAVAKKIKDLFELWGITQSYVRETLWNIAFYGDSFDINIITDDGVEEVVPQDMRTVLDRIEFKATDAAKRMKGKTGAFINRDPRLKQLANELENDAKNGNYASMFKSYLMGFQLEGDLFVPPWGVNHYRLNSKRSEFWPFGRSMFIYSIGPFRQLKTSKNLMALTRAMSFPKDVYTIETSENMTESEKWEAVEEARMEFHNLGASTNGKDDFSVGSEIWIPSGLINHEQIKSDLRVEDIADVELLRDDMIMGTRIPKGYLVVDRASFGSSGQSLLQQHKPFGRAVFSIQSVFLENLTALVKMHFLITGEFDKEMTEFELALNFPVMEEAQDRLRMKNDTLRLAKDVLDNIGQAVGLDRDEALPTDVVKDIFSKYSFLTPEEMDTYISAVEKQKGQPDTGKEPDEFSLYADISNSKDQILERTRNKLAERLNEDIILDAMFEAKRNMRVEEGVFNKRHFVSSIRSTKEQQHMYSLLRKEVDDKKLNEKVF
jgi:hypothetical protein